MVFTSSKILLAKKKSKPERIIISEFNGSNSSLQSLQPPSSPSSSCKSKPPSVMNTATTISHLKQIHTQLIKSSNTTHLHPTFFSKLLSLSLTSSTSIHYALNTFLHVQNPSTSLCNRFLKVLSRSHDPRKTFAAYQHMRVEGLVLDRFSFPPLLKALSRYRGDEGGEIHGVVTKLGFGSDPFVQTGLVRFYSVTGGVDDAKKVFDSIIHRDLVAWGVMFDGYCQSGRYDDVLLLFEEMQKTADSKPDQVVLISILSACARTENLSAGQAVHSYMETNCIEVDEHLQSSLINMYASCGSLDLAKGVYDKMRVPKNLVASTALVFGYMKVGKIAVARVVFDEMPEKDLVSWSAIISGYVESETPNEALVLFNRMLEVGVKPDQIVMLSVISACGHLGALDHAKWINSFVDKNEFQNQIPVCNALIDMYSKCGSLQLAWEVFEQMPKRNVITWTSMITGLAMHGDGEAALRLFDRMKCEGVEPNGVTFVSLLYACSHAGLVNDGRRIFRSMVEEHNITPKIEHYGCMVDLLGRGKLLSEAFKLIKRMPIRANVVVWGSLLGAARVHGDMQIGELAARQLLELDTCHDGAYVLLSNIYAKANRWEDVIKLRRRMKEKGLVKEKAHSWIELGGLVHEFSVGDRNHPRSAEIFEKLSEIVKELKIAGYSSIIESVLVNLEEEEKEEAVLWHSEKLALSFALISSVKGSQIRIAKNLRVCDDCHSFMKVTSLVFGREIVLRDRTRFHHFRDGMCSCKEFW